MYIFYLKNINHNSPMVFDPSLKTGSYSTSFYSRQTLRGMFPCFSTPKGAPAALPASQHQRTVCAELVHTF